MKSFYRKCKIIFTPAKNIYNRKLGATFINSILNQNLFSN